MNELDNLTPSFAESMDVTITEKCNGGCKYCFDEDTEVSTHNGKVKIVILWDNDYEKNFIRYRWNKRN